MDDAEVRRRWRAWAEKEIGGRDTRVEAATAAAMAAVNQRQNQSAVIIAARRRPRGASNGGAACSGGFGPAENRTHHAEQHRLV